MKNLITIGTILFLQLTSFVIKAQEAYLLKPERVFDGNETHTGWVVLVSNGIIEAAGPASSITTGNAEIISLPGCTLLPGLIEGHSHILLHPYNETSWNDQVLKESQAERVVRATVHAKNTLMAGFTTLRDLGTEGAGYADVGIKKSIEEGIIPGPRMLVVTRAIVATGSYGPKGFADNVVVPLGAEEADGDHIVKVVRDQIGKGADLIKVYADYRWGPDNEAEPTFSVDELQLMVQTAESSGRYVVAHASTPEGMRRAVMAGVRTIEHGDGGTAEVFKLMHDKGVYYCPTIAAGDAVSQYNGWKKGVDEDPFRIIEKKKTFKLALSSGVKIMAGGDVGVFTHGDNARELEMMVEYGMKPADVLKSATSINAEAMFMQDKIGFIKKGLFADIIAVQGDPTQDIHDIRNIKLVMKGGRIYRKDE